MFKKLLIPALLVLMLVGGSLVPVRIDAGSISAITPASAKGNIGINVLLNTKVTKQILAELGNYGKVRDVLYYVNAVTLQAKANQIAAIKALPYVAAANPDAKRTGSPVDTVLVEDFADGLSTWNLDAINVTRFRV